MRSKINTNRWLEIPAMVFFLLFAMAQASCRDVKGKSGNAPELKTTAAAKTSKPCENISNYPTTNDIGLELAVVATGASSLKEYDAVASAVEAAGGRVAVGLPPRTMVVYLPKTGKARIKGLDGVLAVISPGESETPSLRNKLDAAQRKILEKFEAVSPPLSGAEPEPPPHDTIEPPPIDPDAIQVKVPKSLPPGVTAIKSSVSGADARATVSMSGKVVYYIFFPESNGAIDANLENWDIGGTMVANAVAEIAAGAAWWVARSPADQNLSFEGYYYDPATEVAMQTSYEPINRDSNDQRLWMNEILTNLGYADANYFDKMNSFNTWARSNHSADEAYIIWVVNDLFDTDNRFEDEQFAYAYLGGPCEVMTYENDGYGIDNMDAVHAHETGHIFHAYDEYDTAPCSCSQSSNGCPNWNCENDCQWNESCIMRGQVSPYTLNAVCDCTRGQVGWGCGDCSLGVVVSSVSALSRNGRVKLSWKTSNESNNDGWNVYRCLTVDGTYDKLNVALISPYQYDYTYIDDTAANGTKYYYKVEDVDTGGDPTLHGPVWAIPSPADVDGSQRVDGLDLILLSRAQGSVPAGPGWLASADIDGDDDVDDDDMVILDAYFGLVLNGK